MKLENQVCSLDLAKRLKELGAKQESYFQWRHEMEGNDYSIFPSYPSEPGWDLECSAFTVAELGQMLPMTIGGRNADSQYWWCLDQKAEKEADARAKVLIRELSKRKSNERI